VNPYRPPVQPTEERHEIDDRIFGGSILWDFEIDGLLQPDHVADLSGFVRGGEKGSYCGGGWRAGSVVIQNASEGFSLTEPDLSAGILFLHGRARED